MPGSRRIFDLQSNTKVSKFRKTRCAADYEIFLGSIPLYDESSGLFFLGKKKWDPTSNLCPESFLPNVFERD